MSAKLTFRLPIAVVLLLLSSGFLSAQWTITRQFVGAGAVSSTPVGNQNWKLSATVGETVIGTVNGDIISTIGFQQPHDDVLTALIEVGDQRIEVQYYPNPTREWLGVSLGDAAHLLHAVELQNLLGQRMQYKAINPGDQEIRFDQLDRIPGGTYQLRARDHNGRYHSLGLVLIAD